MRIVAMQGDVICGRKERELPLKRLIRVESL